MKNLRSFSAVALLFVVIILVNVSAGATPPYDTYNSTGWRSDLLQKKNLPPGFFDFVLFPQGAAGDRIQSEIVGVVCKSWHQAISYAVRYRRGMPDDVIIRDIASYWKGRNVCGHLNGGILRPTHYAVRGDQYGNRISIIRFEDERGIDYYSGFPIW
jgi:hypothetical protein